MISDVPQRPQIIGSALRQCHVLWAADHNQPPSASSRFIVIPRVPDTGASRLIVRFELMKVLWGARPLESFRHLPRPPQWRYSNVHE